MLEQACRQVSAWRAQNLWGTQQTVAVNISAKQLANKDVPQLVATVLERNGIGRGHLEIELTESNMLVNPELAIASRHALTNMGVRAAIDDFGTGYSSLSYLQRFPFDTIKIDRTFVRGDGTGDRRIILRSIIALAHDLGMDVVAEGAESEADEVDLNDLGCEFVQGFLYGQPMTAQEATKLIFRNVEEVEAYDA